MHGLMDVWMFASLFVGVVVFVWFPFYGICLDYFLFYLIFSTILISKIRCHFSCDASEIDSKLCL